MLDVLLLATTLILAPAAQAVTLPATPQGKHVQAYLDAFNSGEVQKYLAMMDEHLEPALVKKRTVEERKEMFERIRGDFGTLRVARVKQATAETIELVIPNQQGEEATFSFTFETAAPHRIAGIRVEIDRGSTATPLG